MYRFLFTIVFFGKKEKQHAPNLSHFENESTFYCANLYTVLLLLLYYATASLLHWKKEKKNDLAANRDS